MINHEHKFIFIHIPKTAGTSIESLFVPNAGKRDVPFKHTTFNKLHKMSPDMCRDYFTFTFTRNPYSLLVSTYNWSKNPKNIGQRNKSRWFSKHTFKEFILSLNSPPGRLSCRTPVSWIVPDSQYSYIQSSDGAINLDYIGKVERLQQDFDIICDKIKINRQQLPHVNETNQKHYSEYYDDETRRIVAKKYAKDIELFGYKFGE